MLKDKFKEFAGKIFGKAKEKTDALPETEIPQQDVAIEQPVFTQEKVKPITEDVSKSAISEKSEHFLKEMPKETTREKIAEIITKEEPSKEILMEVSKKSNTFVSKPKETMEISSEQPKITSEKALIIGQKIEEPVLIQETSEEYKSLSSKKPEKVKTSVISSIKSIFSQNIKLSEKEISDFLDEFEMSLLEADVSIDSAKSIVDSLKIGLQECAFSKSDVMEDIRQNIKKTLLSQLDIDCNLDHYILDKEKKPLIVMFVGPNGAGKTTTIAKFAYLYKKLGKSVVLASGDTFRAGSIDQLEKHAERLNVKIVKQKYGSDPAAVAYDAVSSAKASGSDIVLIDTAGRQETNINLMQELKKIKRVVSPDLVIYIGEAQAGQAIVEQISKFEQEIGLTGVILTKIDTDPKGGVAISILNQINKPIFYIGTGQEYGDLQSFSPEFIVERIV